MTKTLTTETIKLWRINAEITLGETDELDPENNAAKAILDLTAELLRYREAEENPSCWEIAGQLFTTKEEALKPGYRGTPEPLYDGPVLTDDREAQPVAPREQFESLCNQFWNWAEFDEINTEEEPRLKWDGKNYSHRVTAALWRMYQAAPPAPAVVKLPTEFYSDEGVVVRLEEVMAALALVGVKYERKGNACRAAMLAQPVSQGCNWIACGEQLPAVGETVLVSSDGYVSVGELELSGANYRYFTSVATGRELTVTHWMPLPAAPGRRQRPETRTAPQ